MSELKPCPFCGSTDLYEVEQTDDIGNRYPAIFCNSCKATVSVEDNSQTVDDEERMKYLTDKTKKIWNRRIEFPDKNPQKVIYPERNYSGLPIAQCPKCGNRDIDFGQCFCWECGQKLDWNDNTSNQKEAQL